MLSAAGDIGNIQANVRPVIVSLTAAPNPLTRGTILTLTAGGAADPDGARVAKVEFYYDTNGDGLFDKSVDARVGLDGSPRHGWSTGMDTGWLHSGTRTFFARSRDFAGAVSKPAVARVTVQAPQTRANYVGSYVGELKFSNGFVDVLTMDVSGQTRGYLSGTMHQETTGYDFTFTATILKNNRLSFVFGGDGSGSGSGTISADRTTISGTFSSQVGRQRSSGTFRVTRV
jgi:hypothetical protein